jgi:hypothetical protein
MKKKTRVLPFKRRAPLEIVYWEVGVNLVRDGKWNKRHIDAMFREHKVREGQCIALFNNSHYFGGSGYHPPKCRLYVNLGGEPVTLIPAVDEGSQVDYQHRLNDWIRENFGTGLTNVDEVFDDFDSAYAVRTKRMRGAALAQKLLKKARG